VTSVSFNQPETYLCAWSWEPSPPSPFPPLSLLISDLPIVPACSGPCPAPTTGALPWPKGYQVTCRIQLPIWGEPCFHSVAEPVSSCLQVGNVLRMHGVRQHVLGHMHGFDS
jgi:hypothetical protein